VSCYEAFLTALPRVCERRTAVRSDTAGSGPLYDRVEESSEAPRHCASKSVPGTDIHGDVPVFWRRSPTHLRGVQRSSGCVYFMYLLACMRCVSDVPGVTTSSSRALERSVRTRRAFTVGLRWGRSKQRTRDSCLLGASGERRAPAMTEYAERFGQ
jgi:hypothetical protein